MADPRPILSTEAMRAAERLTIESGASVETLMERAGAAIAEAAFQFAGPMPALILAGPGNNGGDGYVAARILAERGFAVRIAGLGEPRSGPASAARKRWSGPVEGLSTATEAAPLLIDALFGTGLRDALEVNVHEQFLRLHAQSRLSLACDVPSGIDSDSGAELSQISRFSMTIALGALKPAHLLFPAMHRCGRLVLADIGIAARAEWHEIAAPQLPPLAPGGHKYARGMVHALAGRMPGAIALGATAASRAGAGYVRISTSTPIQGVPHSIVQVGSADLSDKRIGCILVGPGLGELQQLLTLALTSTAPKVIDADAIRLVGDPGRLRGQDCIVTPHSGEFEALFGEGPGTKPDRALDAARRSDSVVVFKGPDTLVASPDGRVGFAPPAPPWLASAGTGDVLAGMIAAFRARGMSAFDAASAGVWLHGRAAEAAGPAMNADDLAAAIPDALAILNG